MTSRQQQVVINLMTLSAEQLARLLLGVTSLCWAVALVHHPATHPALVLLLEIFPAHGWALIFFGVSALEFGALLKMLPVCSMVPVIRGLLAVLWLFIAISLLFSNIIAAGDVTVSFLAIWLFMRQAVRDECNGSH